MLRGIIDLRRFTIAATDGYLGRVGDVCFDDRSWSVRYLVVDAGTGLPSCRVLVSPSAVRRSEPPILHVAVSKQQFAASPDVSTRGLLGSSTPSGGVKPANLARAGENGDVHLKTATEVMGYDVQTEDGKIGHVKDVLVDDQAWAIRYLVVDTEHRWEGKTVLVSPAWLINVTWDASKTLYCIVTAVDNGIGSRGGSDSIHRVSVDCRTPIPSRAPSSVGSSAPTRSS